MQHPYFIALFIILAVGVVSWLVSIVKNDVSFVDSLWSLFFLIAAVVFAIAAQPLTVKGTLVLVLVALPLLLAIALSSALTIVDVVAATLWLVGFVFEPGGWWSIVSPLLMSLLLLKVSGVAMLENTFSDRRPEYADYIRLTNAFFPGPRRENDTRAEGKL